MKRLLALLLAVLIVFSLVACSEKDDDDKKSDKSQSGEKVNTEDGLMLGLENEELELGTTDQTLDLESIYANIEYDERYFYGDYRILGNEDGEAEYAKSISYVDSDKVGDDEKLSAIPFRLTAGKHTLSHKLNYVEGRNFLRAYFYTSSGNMTYYLCEYFVDGNTLTLKLIDKLEWNEDSTHVRCIMSNTTFTYTFSFQGRKLTLTDGTDTVEMYSALDVDSDEPYVTLDNYLPLGAESLKGMDYLYALFMGPSDYDDNSYSRFSMQDSETYARKYGRALMEDDGRITITLVDEQTQSSETFQMAYIYCFKDGMILTDGDKTYFFQHTRSDRNGNALGGGFSIEDAQKLENMSDEKLEQIVQMRADLLTDLAAAFRNAGIAVTIDEESGEITMDASVLFPVDGYEVSEEGKALLQQFMTIYTGIVFDEKYAGFVSKIMVEGHTDSDGDYDYNLTLSQNRADSVKAFCLSSECGVDAYSAQLTEMLQAIGYSSDKLVRDANGNEDKAASRRVAFRFVINLDN